MVYLIIGLVVGLIADRYIMPVFDMLLELLSHRVNKTSTSIQIDTGLMNVDYQEIIDRNNQLSPVVGFLSEPQNEDQYYEDEEDDQDRSKKIGFIK